MIFGSEIIGRRYWILIWYGILALGLSGLIGAGYWAKRTHGRNRDELLRAAGTTLVSVGMLLVLYEKAELLSEILLVAALLCFVLAFIIGRRPDAFRIKDPDDEGPAQGTDSQ